MQVKCGGTNVPVSFAPKINNRRGTNIYQNVWLGCHIIRFEIGKYGVPPVICRAPPYLSVEIGIFEGSGQRGPIKYKWSELSKIRQTGKMKGRQYCSNYLRIPFVANVQTLTVYLALGEGVT